MTTTINTAAATHIVRCYAMAARLSSGYDTLAARVAKNRAVSGIPAPELGPLGARLAEAGHSA